MTVLNVPPPGSRLVLAASTGGHLAELVRIAPRLEPRSDSVWITFDSGQSRSLLRGRPTMYVPFVAPRDPLAVLRASRVVARRLWKERSSFAGAVSTGCAVALSVLPVTRALGIQSLFIESLARLDGPSLTGKILQRMPGIDLACQNPSWGGDRWGHMSGVLGSFSAIDRDVVADPLRIFVTVGTLAKFEFRALLDRLTGLGIAQHQVVWQVPSAHRSLPGRVESHLTSEEFDEQVRAADVVVCHAGVGTLMRAWELGKYPVVVPRRRHRGEHVDDHQLQIASLVHHHGLGVVREVPLLEWKDLRYAASRAVMEDARAVGADLQPVGRVRGAAHSAPIPTQPGPPPLTAWRETVGALVPPS
jgi:UDP-N-acetylglucosamine transferase subunit ALG13